MEKKTCTMRIIEKKFEDFSKVCTECKIAIL